MQWHTRPTKYFWAIFWTSYNWFPSFLRLYFPLKGYSPQFCFFFFFALSLPRSLGPPSPPMDSLSLPFPFFSPPCLISAPIFVRSLILCNVSFMSPFPFFLSGRLLALNFSASFLGTPVRSLPSPPSHFLTFNSFHFHFLAPLYRSLSGPFFIPHSPFALNFVTRLYSYLPPCALCLFPPVLLPSSPNFLPLSSPSSFSFAFPSATFYAALYSFLPTFLWIEPLA